MLDMDIRENLDIKPRVNGYNDDEVELLVVIGLSEIRKMIESLGFPDCAHYLRGRQKSRRFDIYLRSAIRVCRGLGYSLHELSLITGLGMGKLNYMSKYDGLWAGDSLYWMRNYSRAIMEGIEIKNRQLKLSDRTLYYYVNELLGNYYLLCEVLGFKYSDHHTSRGKNLLLTTAELDSDIDYELKLLLGLYRVFSYDKEDISNLLLLPYDFVCAYYRSDYFIYEGELKTKMLELKEKVVEYGAEKYKNNLSIA
jgi:hypothetical protein